ncbi:MAG: tRNA (guanosine(37)-N1)-methyltransferase TrmD [Clostridia bacterium]|nr:MAG: tRNA (guanosine(37)-N1)-methyltransferase TrmD [Clostridia bacterium]
MRIDILTIFPQMFTGPLTESIIKRAREKGLVDIVLVNIRDYSPDRHGSVDDYPYGGGAGMVMRPEPVFLATEAVRRENSRVILLSPQGSLLRQEKVRELATCPHLVLICGHYEGLDERIREYLVDEEISIGDYILTGGELPAMVVVDAVVRLIPEVLGASASLEEESFSHGLLEYPQYTRPRDFRGMKVPEVLLSGNHQEVARWRREQAVRRTLARRPDLLGGQQLPAGGGGEGEEGA